MKKKIFKQPTFYIATVSLFLTLFFVIQEGAVALLGSILWLLTCIVSLYKANKTAR